MHLLTTSTIAPLLAAITLLTTSASAHHGACKPVSYNLTVSGTNRVLKGTADEALSSEENYFAFLRQPNGQQTVNGTYTIRGSYCPPTTPHHKHEAPLMLFVHGITYSRIYWSALEKPAIHPNEEEIVKYNWVDYAAKKGYHTIAIDRLGEGVSDHPDWKEVQEGLQAAIYVKLVEKLKHHYDHITWVGHSYGSFLGLATAALNPNAVDAYVLTGVAQPGPNDNFASALYRMGGLESASDFDSSRFPSSVFGDGYVVTGNKTFREGAFYSIPGEDFDPAVFERDYATMETVSIAEQAYNTSLSALGYTKPVFAMTGMFDAALCGNGTVDQADCRGTPNKVDNYLSTGFPNAERRISYLQPESGHDQLLHFTWKKGVEKAHEFLDSL